MTDDEKKKTAKKRIVKKDVIKSSRVKKSDSKITTNTNKIKRSNAKKIKEIKEEKIDKVKEDKIKISEEVEEDVKRNLEFNLVEVILIILVTSALVSIASGIVIFKNYDKLSSIKPISEITTSNEILDNYNMIINNYVNEVDKDGLKDAAIKGMYDYLKDEYSIYIDKDINDSLQDQLSGKYSGIGIEITTNDKKEIIVNRVFADSPAYKAGLKKGDILIKIDGKDLKDKDPSYVSDIIRKSDKNEFTLVYKREDKESSVKIKREVVTIEVIETKEYDNVGYIKLDTFSSVSSDQVKKGLDSFNNNVKSLIIDLRNNTGGYLNVAYDMIDLFLDKGQIAYQIKDKDGNITAHKASNDKYKKYDKIVVLINGSSASASEILTLALKENLNAIIVGTKSYGKGTVQETKQLSSGAMVKYTTSYWLSPKGNSINKIGIKPDYEVKGDEKQLNKALEVAK